jgi:hypothetical protein
MDSNSSTGFDLRLGKPVEQGDPFSKALRVLQFVVHRTFGDRLHLFGHAVLAAQQDSHLGVRQGSVEIESDDRHGRRSQPLGEEHLDANQCQYLTTFGTESTAPSRLLHLPSVERDWQSVAGAGISTEPL